MKRSASPPPPLEIPAKQPALDPFVLRGGLVRNCTYDPTWDIFDRKPVRCTAVQLQNFIDETIADVTGLVSDVAVMIRDLAGLDILMEKSLSKLEVSMKVTESGRKRKPIRLTIWPETHCGAPWCRCARKEPTRFHILIDYTDGECEPNRLCAAFTTPTRDSVEFYQYDTTCVFKRDGTFSIAHETEPGFEKTDTGHVDPRLFALFMEFLEIEMEASRHWNFDEDQQPGDGEVTRIIQGTLGIADFQEMKLEEKHGAELVRLLKCVWGVKD